MSRETSTIRSLRYGPAAIAALALSLGLALGNLCVARAQTDPGQDDQQRSYAVVPDQTPSGDEADQNSAAQASADAAEEELESATEARDQLESDGASQDQIDAANRAIAQARADKQAADQAAQAADQSQESDQSQ